MEMIGYFSDDEGSQGYPLGLLRLFYMGNTGLGQGLKNRTVGGVQLAPVA